MFFFLHSILVTCWKSLTQIWATVPGYEIVYDVLNYCNVWCPFDIILWKMRILIFRRTLAIRSLNIYCGFNINILLKTNFHGFRRWVDPRNQMGFFFVNTVSYNMVRFIWDDYFLQNDVSSNCKHEIHENWHSWILMKPHLFIRFRKLVLFL